MPIPPFRQDGWLPVGHHRATWDEIVERFGGVPDSRRGRLTATLVDLRDAFRSLGVVGYVLLNGSYISAKEAPGDFDLMLIGPPNLQAMRDHDPKLALLLDAERAENEGGYSLFYAANDSENLALLLTFWDVSKEGVPKGSVEVEL